MAPTASSRVGALHFLDWCPFLPQEAARFLCTGPCCPEVGQGHVALPVLGLEPFAACRVSCPTFLRVRAQERDARGLALGTLSERTPCNQRLTKKDHAKDKGVWREKCRLYRKRGNDAGAPLPFSKTPTGQERLPRSGCP